MSGEKKRKLNGESKGKNIKMDKKQRQHSSLSFSTDKLRSIVREALNKVVQGDLFVQGLEEKSIDMLHLPETEEHKKFMEYIVTQSSTSKKERKMLSGFFKEKKEIVLKEVNLFVVERASRSNISKKDEILNIDNNSSKSEANSNVLSTPSNFSIEPQNVTEDSNDSPAPDETIENEHTEFHPAPKKKGKKRKKAFVSHDALDSEQHSESEDLQMPTGEKSAENSTSNVAIVDAKNLHLTPRQRELKVRFEEEKNKVLEKLPRDYRNRFRSLCFIKWSKSFLPAIEISPYDVEPGPVRTQWSKMIKAVTKQKRDPTHLIYWYGSDPSEGYSFMPKKQIKTLKQGIEEGYDKIPLQVQKKLDSGKPLTSTEAQHVRGLEEFNKDRELPPSERIAWMRTFEEEYMLHDDDDEDAALPTEAATSFVRKENPPMPTKKKIKEKTKKSKKTQKKDKEQDFTDDSMHLIPPDEVAQPQEEERQKEEKQVPEEDLQNQISTPAQKNQEEKPITKKKSDESKKRKLERGKREKTKKSKKSIESKSNTEEAVNSVEVPEIQEQLDEKSIHSTKSTLNESTEDDTKTSQQFEAKLTLAIPEIKQAIANKNAKGIVTFLKKLKRKASLMSMSFMETSGLPELLKTVKKAFKGVDEEVFSLTKEVFISMKEIYRNKKKDIETQDEQEEIHNTQPEPSPRIEMKSPTPEKEKKANSETPSKPSHDYVSVPKIAKKTYHENDKKLGTDRESKKEVKSEPTIPSVPRKNKESSTQSNNKETTNAEEKESNAIESPEAPVPPSPPPPPPPAQAKPAKKSFTLKNILCAPKPQASPSIPNTRPKETTKSLSNEARENNQLRKWLTDPCTDAKSTSLTNDRLFAYDFLFEAFSLISSLEDKVLRKINPDFASRSLELAIFKFASENSRTEKKHRHIYWQKLHDIVAAIKGNTPNHNPLMDIKNGGSIVALMMKGYFATSHDVVKLSKKQLFESYEGRNVVL